MTRAQSSRLAAKREAAKKAKVKSKASSCQRMELRRVMVAVPRDRKARGRQTKISIRFINPGNTRRTRPSRASSGARKRVRSGRGGVTAGGGEEPLHLELDNDGMLRTAAPTPPTLSLSDSRCSSRRTSSTAPPVLLSSGAAAATKASLEASLDSASRAAMQVLLLLPTTPDPGDILTSSSVPHRRLLKLEPAALQVGTRVDARKRVVHHILITDGALSSGWFRGTIMRVTPGSQLRYAVHFDDGHDESSVMANNVRRLRRDNASVTAVEDIQAVFRAECAPLAALATAARAMTTALPLLKKRGCGYIGKLGAKAAKRRKCGGTAVAGGAFATAVSSSSTGQKKRVAKLKPYETKYTGAVWHKTNKRWMARLNVTGCGSNGSKGSQPKRVNLGYHDTDKMAAMCFDAGIVIFGLEKTFNFAAAEKDTSEGGKRPPHPLFPTMSVAAVRNTVCSHSVASHTHSRLFFSFTPSLPPPSLTSLYTLPLLSSPLLPALPRRACKAVAERKALAEETS